MLVWLIAPRTIGLLRYCNQYFINHDIPRINSDISRVFFQGLFSSRTSCSSSYVPSRCSWLNSPLDNTPISAPLMYGNSVRCSKVRRLWVDSIGSIRPSLRILKFAGLSIMYSIVVTNWIPQINVTAPLCFTCARNSVFQYNINFCVDVEHIVCFPCLTTLYLGTFKTN